jgi:hypothetical protein
MGRESRIPPKKRVPSATCRSRGVVVSALGSPAPALHRLPSIQGGGDQGSPASLSGRSMTGATRGSATGRRSAEGGPEGLAGASAVGHGRAALTSASVAAALVILSPRSSWCTAGNTRTLHAITSDG